MTKLNLLMNGTDVRAGYKNIDAFPALPNNQAFSQEKEQGDIANLDWVVEDDTCEHIVANNVLETFFLPKVPEILGNWIKKLKKGGVLTITTIDLKEVAKNYAQDMLEWKDAVVLLYGPQQSGIWDMYKGAFAVDVLENTLKSFGLLITKTRLNNFKILIEAEK